MAMTARDIDRRRQARRRRELRRRSVRRRRAVAFMVISGILLLLTFLIAAQVPAESDASPEGPSAEVAHVECPEGMTKADPAAEPSSEAEAECVPSEEEAEEQGPEEPAEEERENPETSEPAPESGGETSVPSEPAPESQPQAPVSHEHEQRSVPVVGSSLKAPRSHGGGAPNPSRGPRHGHSSHSSHARHGKDRGSGGTSAATRTEGATVPAEWNWSGPWAIPWQIVACESGGSYSALNPSSGAGGAYQIIPSTWQAYGGQGLPQLAPPAEQDRIAAEIWADSGPSAWACAQGGAWLGAGLSGAYGLLPDPLPPARRLDATFVSSLTRIARANRVDWALLLALVRLRGGRGHVPASDPELRRLASDVGALGSRRLPVEARRLFARRANSQRLLALTYYDRAVGRRGLVQGLDAVKGSLEKRVLRSRRLLIYPGGRADVEAGRVDVRVLTVLLYLAQRYRSVTVTSLLTGHSFFTTEGRPSLHAFGRAVDIAALNGTPILGHQQPGGLTEVALRRILLLPRELQPSELISLFDLGGPSFALADHADHIHVGF
jgi:transglycosylase-like protein